MYYDSYRQLIFIKFKTIYFFYSYVTYSTVFWNYLIQKKSVYFIKSQLFSFFKKFRTKQFTFLY
jgi:hypothetical protein